MVWILQAKVLAPTGNETLIKYVHITYTVLKQVHNKIIFPGIYRLSALSLVINHQKSVPRLIFGVLVLYFISVFTAEGFVHYFL